MFAHEKVYTWIKDNIDSQRWDEGSRIPNEMDLTREFQVSRDTVRKALARLNREGYIYRKSGHGTFVKRLKSDYRLNTLNSFTEQMRERGLTPSSEILEIESGPLKDARIRGILGVGKADAVYVVTRVRKANDIPMAFELVHVSLAVCPDFEFYVKKYDSLFQVYETVYKYEIDFGRVILEATKCVEPVCSHLDLPRNSPILTMNCTTYLMDQRPLYHVICHYSSEHYFFSQNIPRKIK